MLVSKEFRLQNLLRQFDPSEDCVNIYLGVIYTDTVHCTSLSASHQVFYAYICCVIQVIKEFAKRIIQSNVMIELIKRWLQLTVSVAASQTAVNEKEIRTTLNHVNVSSCATPEYLPHFHAILFYRRNIVCIRYFSWSFIKI